jgi:hypothetical protein
MIGLVGARCARADGAGLLECLRIGCVSFPSDALRDNAIQAKRWLESHAVYISEMPAPSRYTSKFIFVEYREDEPLDLADARAATRFHDGWTQIVVGAAWSRLTLAAARENLIRHELLHALGFEHSNNPLSLMHPRVGWWPVRRGLLPGERDELRRVYG